MLKTLFCILLMSSGITCKGMKYQYLPDGRAVSGPDCTSTKSGINSRSSGFSVWGFLTAGVVVATAIGNLVRKGQGVNSIGLNCPRFLAQKLAPVVKLNSIIYLNSILT